MLFRKWDTSVVHLLVISEEVRAMLTVDGNRSQSRLHFFLDYCEKVRATQTDFEILDG